ncbi:hypothetical protein [Mycobacteroides abscessus]
MKLRFPILAIILAALGPAVGFVRSPLEWLIVACALVAGILGLVIGIKNGEPF